MFELGFYIYQSYDRIAFVPYYQRKEYAVYYLMKMLNINSYYDLVIGLGDNDIDVNFMNFMFFCNDSTKFQFIKIICFKDLIMKTSYNIDDVQFLLKDLTEVALKNKADGINDFAMSIEEKEKAIQSNLKHYSEIVNLEKPPTKEYLDIYYKVLKNRTVMDFIY